MADNLDDAMSDVEEVLHVQGRSRTKRWEVSAVSLEYRTLEETEKVIEDHMNDSWSWLGCNNKYIFFTRYKGR